MNDGTFQSTYDSIFGLSSRAPERPCLIGDDGVVWTYGRLAEYAEKFAATLDGLGIVAGDRVAVQVDKSPWAVALYLACLRQGLVYLPLNTAYTVDEVGYFTADASVALFVGRDGHATADGVETATLNSDGSGSLWAAATRGVPAPAATGLDDMAALLYTSGTTGRSKGAMLSGRNLVANAVALHDSWRFTPDDVLVHVLPIFHVHGLFVALHCAFLAGAAVRFHERFDVEAVRSDLRHSTVLMGVPTHYHRLLADPAFGADDCANMRLFTSGSAPLLAGRHDEFTSRSGHRIVERYGMTETMILTSNPVDDGPDGRAQVAGTVGFALPGVDLRVVDDEGTPVPPGDSGTVEVMGDGVCLGYWNRADVAVGPGWFSTGDIGTLDDAGRLSLSGRASDMIISGGLNIYPAEIEHVLDAVEGVEESAVIGLPDEDFGEQVTAVIVGDHKVSDTLWSACESLASFKRPRRYKFVDALPRNAMGKVQKKMLRERFGA